MRTHARTFSWHLDSPPETIWPALSDTARFNEAAALPKHEIEERLQPDGSVRFFAQARRGPFPLAWEEIPVEWVDKQWFRHLRVFSVGPLTDLCATLRVRPDGGSASIVEYTVEATPRNPIGWVILKTGFFPSIERSFGTLVENVREWAAGLKSRPYENEPVALDPAIRQRLDGMLARIEASGNGHDLAATLANWLLSAQEVDLQRIRPLALARMWSASPRHVVELCLQAVREGLLEMSWDLLCPRCRGAKTAVGSLDRLPSGAHCDACNIDYGRDFARNVELTFRPAPSIRLVANGEFCLFGPMATPHVKVQLTVPPGGARTVPARLAPGTYRLRTLETGGETDIVHEGDGFPALVLSKGDVRAADASAAGEVHADNREDRPRTAIIEALDWVEDALTAHRATTMQTFRELFSNEALRPGDEVGVAQVTLMFTDIKGSTALYERVGDAGAYRIVREHFAYLAQTVRRADGAVVKTIGDAIMASFSNPADGIRAALAVQAGIADFNARIGEHDVIVRVGLHVGPCIAVTLNDRLDYFGTTVNLAARLESESQGGDIVVSEVLLQDPAVAALLEGRARTRQVEHIRGFDQPVAYYRFSEPTHAAAA